MEKSLKYGCYRILRISFDQSYIQRLVIAQVSNFKFEAN